MISSTQRDGDRAGGAGGDLIGWNWMISPSLEKSLTRRIGDPIGDVGLRIGEIAIAHLLLLTRAIASLASASSPAFLAKISEAERTLLADEDVRS